MYSVMIANSESCFVDKSDNRKGNSEDGKSFRKVVALKRAGVKKKVQLLRFNRRNRTEYVPGASERRQRPWQ